MNEDQPLPPALEGLREIRLPAPVSYAPQTIGWWVVFAVVLVVLGYVAWRLWRRYQRNAYRRLALARLAGVAPAQFPALLKRAALDAYPRDDVAELSGGPWLAFLDRSYGGSGFTSGPGRILPSLAYADLTLDESQRSELTDLVRTWIQRHRV